MESKIDSEKSLTSWNLCEQNDSIIKKPAVNTYYNTLDDI